MRRVVSVYLPTWPIDRIRRQRLVRSSAAPRDQAIMLVQVDHGRQIVSACCPLCRAAGISPGMTLAHARALLPPGSEPLVQPHEPRRDAEALDSLARWMLRFVPVAAADPPDGLLLDITGCERLHPRENRFLRSLGTRLARLGFASRIACAGAFACAWAVARFHPPRLNIVQPRREQEAIAPLPVAALRLDPHVILALREVGLERIEHLLALSRHDLATRFGPAVSHRLDQALGRAGEIIHPVHEAPPLLVERVFDGPVLQLEAITLTVIELIDQLAVLLRARESGVKRLRVMIERIDADPLSFAIRLSRASRSAKHLWSLLRPRVEAIHMGFGIERIALEASLTGRIRHAQLATGPMPETSDGPHEPDAALGEWLDTMVQRLGPHGVLRMQPVESHVPERAFRAIAAMNATGVPPVIASTASMAGDAMQPRRGLPCGETGNITPSDRPSILFPHPEPAEVIALTPDGPPCRLHWRGREHHVLAAAGPERINDEWWVGSRDLITASFRERDYFKVCDDAGRWLWVFRAATCMNAGQGRASSASASDDRASDGSTSGGGGGGGGASGGSGGWFVHGQWA